MAADYLGLGSRLTSAPSDLLATGAFAHELAGVNNLFHDMGLADLAHVKSLESAQLIDAEIADSLRAGLVQMHNEGPGAIAWDPSLGDIYNNRTVRLKALIGDDARSLHTGRARRESTTVAWQLATRRLIGRLGQNATALATALVHRSDEHRATVMSDYTYLQHAHPTTLAHYLLGFVQPLLRDADRIEAAHRRLNQSPAESGSVNGSRLPLDRVEAATLLGFDEPMPHTRDAMWAPDLALEASTVSLSVAITLDRLAEELILFSTSEFGVVSLADAHCRTSVIMPQKKNPYGLAYVRGVARRAVGMVVGVATAQLMPTGQPDSRTVAYLDVIALLEEVGKATALLAEIVAEASFDTVRMRELAESGHSYATDLGDVLLVEHGISNRSSHEVLGRAIRAATEVGSQVVTVEDLTAAAHELGIEFPALEQSTIDALANVDDLIASRKTMGGAAPEPIDRMLASANFAIEHNRQNFATLLSAAETAEAALVGAAEGDSQ